MIVIFAWEFEGKRTSLVLPMELMALHCRQVYHKSPLTLLSTRPRSRARLVLVPRLTPKISSISKSSTRKSSKFPSLITTATAGVPLPPLDLTEDNVRQVLADTRVELAQLFDASVGMTGVVELAELDGPFVKISLKGRFWHKRSTVLARVGNYLKQRIPEILEVDIEDEKQLDDSPENF